MKLKIKLATKKDFETLIILRYLLMKRDNIIDSSMECTPEALRKSARYMKEYLKTKDNFYMIAYHDNVPVSYLHVTFDDKEDKTLSYISEFYTLELYRGKKIGEKLVKLHWKYLKKKGIMKSALTTSKRGNKRTIDFYKRLEYEITKSGVNAVYFEKGKMKKENKNFKYDLYLGYYNHHRGYYEITTFLTEGKRS